MNNKLLLSLLLATSCSYAMDANKPYIEPTEKDLNDYVTYILDNNPELSRIELAAINGFIRKYYYFNLSESNAQRLDAMDRKLAIRETKHKDDLDAWNYFVNVSNTK